MKPYIEYGDIGLVLQSSRLRVPWQGLGAVRDLVCALARFGAQNAALHEAEALTMEAKGESILHQHQGMPDSTLEKIAAAPEDLEKSNVDVLEEPPHGKWNAFLRAESERIIRELASKIDAAGDDIEALRAILNAAPTVNKLNNTTFKRVKKVETQVHHIVMEAVVAELKRRERLPSNFSLGAVPGHAWLKPEHVAFSTATNASLRPDRLQGITSPEEIGLLVVDLYENYARALDPAKAELRATVKAESKIAKAWFRVNGFWPTQ